MDWSLLGELAKVGVVIALGVSLSAYVLQDKLIFHPQSLHEAQRAAIGAAHANLSDTFLQATDGTRLHAWHLKGASGAPLVIYFGGNAEEVSWMVNELKALGTGASWLLIDYRGYGASEGRPSEATLTADALAWYDHVAKEHARVYAFGRSLGSGVAVHLATERRLDGMVLIAPFDSMVAVGRHHYPFLPVRLLLRHRFDSIERAPKLKIPLLCLAATYDEVIPVAHARRLYEAWGGPKQWVELPVGHNSTDQHPRFWSSVREFIT